MLLANITEHDLIMVLLVVGIFALLAFIFGLVRH